MVPVIVIFISVYFPLFTQAQTGPAGIGNSTNNVLWLRSDQGTSTTTNGEAIEQWLDISGNDNHANQTDAGKRPEFVTTSINGIPALRFGGNNINLVVNDNDNLDNTTGLSILVVARPDNIDTQPRGLVGKRASQSSGVAYALFTYNNRYLYFDSPGRNNGTTAATNDPQIFSAVYDGTTGNPRARIFQQGVQTGSGNSGTSIGNMESDLYIGILNDNYGHGFRGDMSEVIIYRSALNRAQRLIVETYLANRYDINMGPAGYSSTTHNEDFTGIGHAGGYKHSATANMGSGILLAELNGSLNETNEFVFTGHDDTPHGIDNSNLPAIPEVNLDDRWQRIYYIERVQDGVIDGGTTDIRIGFDFDGTGIIPSANRSYYLLYRSGTSGEFSVVAGGSSAVSNNQVWFDIANANFASGYYTLVRTDQEIKSWYSFNDRDWDNPEAWSTNPDIYQNPASEIPGAMDRVVIQGSKVITVKNNNLLANILEVNSGTVDFATTTGHTFSTITGQPSGTIRLAADNFPSGDASGYADPATGGTVEYYGSGHVLTTSRSFRNMRINLSAADDALVLLANYTLSGNLTIQRGELHFGNTSNTSALNLTIEENLEIQSGGKIRTGTGNARHQLNLYSDFLNHGDVQFTNRTAANYTAEASDGIVDVNFLSAVRDQHALLEGPSRFYRIEIRKLSTTYEVNIEANDPAWFSLLGYANQGHPDQAQLAGNTNSLGLLSGRVRLGSNITVPRLNGGGNYNISDNAVLHVDGGHVTKPSGTAVVVYGRIIVSAGTFNANIDSGITTRHNGVFESQGGTTNLRQFRTSVYGAQHQGGYIQSGGTVNMVPGAINNDYYRFTLTYTGNVFHMSGGILHIQQTGGKGGIFINSDPQNQIVTGGRVIVDISNNNDFIITSRAPFWDLEMRKTVANANVFKLDEGVDLGGTGEYLAAQPLRVLRHFRIRGTESGMQGVNFYPVTSVTNVNDVYIGGSFFIESGSQYWTAADGNRSNNYNSMAALPTIMNTTWFNQTPGTPAVSELYWGNPGDVFDYNNNGNFQQEENMAEFGHFVLNRNSGNELRLTSPGPGGGLRGNAALTLDVNGSLTVESGTLCQGRLTIRSWGSITNNDRLGTWYPAGPYPTATGTPGTAQIRFRESEDSAPIINSSANAVFGNTRFNVNINSPFTFSNDMYFERLEYMRGILYLGKYNLKVDDMWNLNGDNNTQTRFFTEGANTSSFLRVADKGRATAGDANQQIMIITDGKTSSAGLSLKVRENSLADTGPNVRNNRSVLTFPIGFSTDNFSTGLTNTYYRPAQVKVKDFSDDGYLNIRPVSGALHASDPTGGEILQHHWKVSHSEFTVLPTLAYRYYYRNRNETGVADLPAGATNENIYVPGKVLDEGDYHRSFESGIPAEQDTDGVFSSPDADTRVIIFNGDNTGTADDGLFGFSANAPGIEAENANYAAGQYERFTGAPLIYYTRGLDRTGTQPLYTAAATWTRSDLTGFDPTNPHLSTNPASPDAPGAGDIVHIGFFPFNDPQTAYRGYPHSARIDAGNLEAARVVFTQMTDEFGNAPVRRKPLSEVGGSNHFQFRPTLTWNSTGTINVAAMEGEGTIRIRGEGTNDNRRDPGFDNVDMGDFVRSDSSYILYETFNSFTINNTPGELPNLMLSSDNWGANNHTLTITKDITTNQNLEILGNPNLVLGTGATGNLHIKGNLFLVPLTNNTGGGELRLRNTGTGRTVIVEGNIWVGRPSGAAATGGNVIRVETGGAVTHTMNVGGNIIINTTGDNTTVAPNGNGLIFGDGTQSHIDLTLKGSTSSSLTNINGNVPGFHKLTVNKGNNQTTGFTFNSNFTLSGPTSGAGIPKALSLLNGTLTLNHEDINIDLTTGNESFAIPSTAGLVVSDGQVNVSGANSGILLSGLLRANGTGIINMDGGPGVNNFIEYSAAGGAAITVENSGQLIVGSQIRRGTTNPSGVLNYRQTGGTVIVGKNAAPVNNRGVFEVINTGSRFTHTGGTLTIVRPQTAATEATVLLEPSLRMVGNATLQIGNADTPAGSTITIKSSITLGNLNVAGSSIARLKDRPLIVNRDLSIGAGSSFDGTGSFSLTVNRHITNQGAANLNVDTLFLRGTGTFPSEGMQNISGDISVKHLVIEPQLSVTLQPDSDVEVTGDMYINSGQLIDGVNTISLKGNITNNASHISTNPVSGGLLFSGTALQRIYGTGQFGRMEIDNPLKVQLENSINLSDNLTITNGIFHIQHHLLTLGENADVVSSNTFDATRMISVYGGSFAPLGIRKYIPAVASATPTNPYNTLDPAYTWKFNYPIGTDDGTNQKYIPMDLHVASNATGGYISVIPVDYLHITFSDPGQDENILHQHWNINSSGLSNFTALHRNHYTQDAVFGSEEEYIGARLFEGFWTKYLESDEPPIEVVYENDNYIAFVHSGVNEISGDYTAGHPDYIPDEVPIYYSRQNGSWTDQNTWERSDGIAVPAGGPVGQRVHIRTGHTVTMPGNFRRSYETRINGRLELGTTINHILGYVRGTGTLATTSSAIPTGNYEEFFGCGGGTMEYGGPGSYTLTDRYLHYNNLTVTGNGIKTMPNANMTICGDLRIEGDATLKASATASGYRYIFIHGDITIRSTANWDLATRSWVDIYGSFEKEDGAGFNTNYSYQTVTFRGSLIKNINGNYVFNNLYNYSDGDLIISGNVSSRVFFRLSGGKIIVQSAGLISNTRSNGFDLYSSGFVEGAVSLRMNQSANNKFLPVGNNYNKKFIYILDLPSSIDYWTGEYIGQSASEEGMDHTSFIAPIETVSQSEYWHIKGPNGVSSRIRLTLDGTSEIAQALGDGKLDQLRIVRWSGSQWEIVGNGATVTGTIDAGTITTDQALTFNGSDQYFTLAAVEAIVLPTAQITSGDADICEGSTYELVIELTGESPWEIDYTDGTTVYTNIAVPSSPHTIDVNWLSSGSYEFSLDEVRNVDGTGVTYGSSAFVEIFSVPEDSFLVTSGGDICGPNTTTIDLNDSEIGVNYQLYRNAVYTGTTLAGTGGPISFTGIDQEGTFTIRAQNNQIALCFTWMNGNPTISSGSSGTAEITALLSNYPICEGEEVQLEIAFTGTGPFNFTIADNHGGTWSDNTNNLIHSFTIPDPPAWISPDLPSVYTYSITYVEDDSGCGTGIVLGSSLDVEVFKIPETGPQYHIPNTFGQ